MTETTGPNTSRRTISSLLQRAGDDRRLVEEARAVARLAAGGDLDVLQLGGALDEARDAVALALGDQRPDLVLGVVRLGRSLMVETAEERSATSLS